MAEDIKSGYISGRPAVKKARETLSKARAALDLAQRALDNTPDNLKDLIKTNTANLNAAKKAVEQAQEAEKLAVDQATSYYNKNKEAIDAEANKGKSDPERLAALKQARAKAEAANLPTAQYDALIKSLERKIADANKSKKAEDVATGESDATGEAPAELRDYSTEITTAGRAIAKMSQTPGALLALTTSLAKAGYNIKPTDKYNENIISVYQQAILDNKSYSTNFNKEVPFEEFLRTRPGAEGEGAGTGGPKVDIYPTITNKQDGRIVINEYFQDKFGRDATNEEFDAAYAKIIAEQKLKPKKQVTRKNAKGETIYETTGGTNTEQILNNFVSSKPKLSAEADAYEASDAKVLQRQKDKKLYDAELAKLGGDAAAIAKLNQTTSYGRSIQSMQNKLAKLALAAGAEFTAEELAEYAKEAIDTSLDLDADSLTAFINSKMKFGADSEGIYKGEAGESVDALNKVAAANGFDLQKVFGSQLPDWLSQINKGESIETYKRIIRDVAKIGMPEKVVKLMDQGIDLATIYAPYKNLMASTLEVTPNSIDLNDPTLRTAITADTEVPLYEFERALRKDNRWQYTNQAKEEVASATQKILQDFGFMG